MPTTNTTDSTAAALRAHGAALVELVAELREASAIQWQEPPRHDMSIDGGVSGTIHDTTPRIALNERRLRVRAAVLGGESALALATDQFANASEALRAAAHTWRGE